jgi:hypothetical protein
MRVSLSLAMLLALAGAVLAASDMCSEIKPNLPSECRCTPQPGGVRFIARMRLRNNLRYVY